MEHIFNSYSSCRELCLQLSHTQPMSYLFIPQSALAGCKCCRQMREVGAVCGSNLVLICTLIMSLLASTLLFLQSRDPSTELGFSAGKPCSVSEFPAANRISGLDTFKPCWGLCWTQAAMWGRAHGQGHQGPSAGLWAQL